MEKLFVIVFSLPPVIFGIMF